MCVKDTNGSFGVVFAGEKIKCATCRKCDCSHVLQFLTEDSEGDIPTHCKSFQPLASPLQSKDLISFDFSEGLQKVLQSPNERFSLDSDGVAHLIPDAATSCAQCSSKDCWGMAETQREALLITPFWIYKAVGKFGCYCILAYC